MTTLDHIRDLADELTEPHVHREPYTVWTGSRHRAVRHHITIQHGLLAQLYRAVLPASTATDGAGGNVPKSAPPLEIEALSRYRQITTAAQTWGKNLGIQRATAESTIRGLVGAASTLDPDDQRALAADLRRWTHWCRVYLGLEQVRQITGVSCPLADCTGRGSLRVNLTTSHALCTACGATWNHDTIGLLAEHIRAGRAERMSA